MKAELIEPAVIRVAQTFVSCVRRRHPTATGWLYGSHARGEAGPESDIDVALILEPSPSAARRYAVEAGGEAFDLLLETGLLVSPIAISTDEWVRPETFSNPFLLRNIEREA